MTFKTKKITKMVVVSIILTHSIFGLARPPEIEGAKAQSDANNLLRVLTQCPDRIWPKLKVPKDDLLLIDSALSEQFLVSPQNRRVLKVANHDLPSEVFSMGFSKILLGSREVLYVNGSGDLGNFDFAIHEAFHAVDQRDWKTLRHGRRGTAFPLLSDSRVARSMVYKNLVRALQNRKQQDIYLEQARYWYDQWIYSDPQENEQTTDGYEGSARYVEILASLLKTHGCNASDDTLLKAILSNELVLSQNILIDAADLDVEGYYLGALAGFLLNFNKSEQNWQQRVSLGETPLEILLKNIQGRYEPVDTELERSTKEVVAKKDVEIGQNLSSARDLMEGKDITFVSISYESYTQSYSPKGFFIDRSTGTSFTPMAAAMNFKFSDLEMNFASKKDAVYIRLTETNPCKGQWNFVVKNSDISKKNNNVFEVQNLLFKGSIKGSYKTDSKARLWLCADK